jgi:CRP-like cAMP-binding protein
MNLRNTKLGSEFKNGDVIIKQGTTGNCLYIIQQGNVEVIIESEDGDKKVAVLTEKDFFGEMGLFGKDVRSCTVRAIDDVKVLTIDKRNFYKTIQKDPSLAFNLLEKMSKRLKDTNKLVK